MSFRRVNVPFPPNNGYKTRLSCTAIPEYA